MWLSPLRNANCNVNSALEVLVSAWLVLDPQISDNWILLRSTNTFDSTLCANVQAEMDNLLLSNFLTSLTITYLPISSFCFCNLQQSTQYGGARIFLRSPLWLHVTYLSSACVDVAPSGHRIEAALPRNLKESFAHDQGSCQSWGDRKDVWGPTVNCQRKNKRS